MLKRIVLQFAALGGHGHRALGGAAQAGDALGDLVDLLQHHIGNLVEQLVQGDEIRTLHVPMRLLDLALQIDGVGQAIIEYDGRRCGGSFSDRSIFVLYMGAPSRLRNLGALFCTALAANPKKERNVGSRIDRGVFGESQFDAPAGAQAAGRADGQLQTGPEKSDVAAGDAAGLAVELRAQRPRGSHRAGGREAREHGTAMRRAAK